MIFVLSIMCFLPSFAKALSVQGKCYELFLGSQVPN